MTYVDEATFKSETIDFLDDHYNLACEMAEAFGNYSPLIVAKDKKSLCFAVNTSNDRSEKEVGQNIYKVTVEKIS